MIKKFFLVIALNLMTNGLCAARTLVSKKREERRAITRSISLKAQILAAKKKRQVVGARKIERVVPKRKLPTFVQKVAFARRDTEEEMSDLLQTLRSGKKEESLKIHAAYFTLAALGRKEVKFTVSHPGVLEKLHRRTSFEPRTTYITEAEGTYCDMSSKPPVTVTIDPFRLHASRICPNHVVSVPFSVSVGKDVIGQEFNVPQHQWLEVMEGAPVKGRRRAHKKHE